MARSGSVNFSITAQEIITHALRKVGVVTGDTPAAYREHLDVALSELNLLVKAWMADGLQMWAREEATLFLQKDTNTYLLGPTGDHATVSYTETALATDEALGSTSLGVDSIAGISNGDNIGIVLDSGSIHWTTVNGAPAGSTVVITVGLPSAASADNAIYVYTTKVNRPLKIISSVLRTSDNQDTPLTVLALHDYTELANKKYDGNVNTISFEPRLDNSRLYIHQETDDVTDRIVFWFQRPLEDFDTLDNNPDFPQEWYMALVYGLADILADTYDVNPIKASRLHKRAMEYKQAAMDFDTEEASILLQPDMEDYA